MCIHIKVLSDLRRKEITISQDFIKTQNYKYILQEWLLKTTQLIKLLIRIVFLNIVNCIKKYIFL